ncbi:MAG: adenylate/guanylate cyclase domain-containing protein [Proteobacteria bacterium]|nr:adenylate/guanylate cyclase domain-containing protein [Pseudomonadota bacterium]MBU1714243.1 adenylate/guanylate cyclase domain-containing protein [Pseudomonadota bacterium]
MEKRLHKKIVFSLLALVSVFAVIVLCYMQTPLLEGFEAKTYDLRFKAMRGAVAARPDIALIAIDGKSIAELGRFPFSRKYYASLVDQVTAAGAKALLMDAFFPEPESAEVDQAFAAAMARAGNVYLAVAFDLNRDCVAVGVTESIKQLSGAAKGSGHINFLPDEDGINRHTMPLIAYGDKIYPSLALRGAMEALGVEEIEQSTFNIKVGEVRIPTAVNGTMMINHIGPPGSYQTFSFVDVVKGRIAADLLKDKLLFMGATALGIYDMRVTPFDGNTPGVEINATIADNIISGNFIRRSGVEAIIDILFIFILGMASFLVIAKLRPFPAFFLLLLLAGGYIAFTYYMFVAGYWFSMVYPLAGMMVASAVSAGFRFVTMDRRAKEIRSIFSSYVSGKVVDQLVNDPEGAGIGVSTKEVTVLFSDLKGFTSYSEQVEPYKLVSTLNEYLAEMTRVIMSHGGTVDKFLGDGIMAYWGAPLAQENHAELAIGCTFVMQERMAALQKKWRKDGTQPFSFRLGINSGEVIAGTIGAKGKKMEYTIIGDSVNLGARLEGTAKFYGVDILVSESTYQATKEKFIYRNLDYIRVVGKRVPIQIYELVAAGDDPDRETLIAGISQFEEALAFYRQKLWGQALAVFEKYSKEYPDDRVAELFVNRCVSFEKDPPVGAWNGVYDRQEK